MPKAQNPLDYKFTSFPLLGMIPDHPRASLAFSTAHLPIEECFAELYGFVLGITPDAVGHHSVRRMTDERPTRLLENKSVKRPVQGIRTKFSYWRTLFFRRKKYRDHIFSHLLDVLVVMRTKQNPALAQAVTSLRDAALDDVLNGQARQEAVIFWNNVRSCLYECPKGITVSEHKKYGCQSRLTTRLWYFRAVMGLNQEHPEFRKWLEDRWPHIRRDIEAVQNLTESRQRCLGCKARTVAGLDDYILQLVLQYFSQGQIRLSEPVHESFHDHFFSALISALCQSDIWLGIGALMQEKPSAGYSKEGLLEMRPKAVGLIPMFSDTVNAVAGAMIDCLADENQH